ncbi:MAG: zinc ribbon domain-containing protein [Cyanobacteria bacterium CRU_2_1]|nr:zinc ribbon domain-containing protein [Cyanobacteria bacterium RU_5_0]NJR60220.1 zinc ribbon domain-containing protein [Cyanobacteria bacterium CRU_2_1]
MSTCPRCHQSVDAQAIACPYCRTVLKAHGHPGIPLFRATEDEYLCQSCTYDEDDSCNYPQRPYAKECTLYHNRLQPIEVKGYKPSLQSSTKAWLRQNTSWLILVGLLVISVLIALRK